MNLSDHRLYFKRFYSIDLLETTGLVFWIEPKLVFKSDIRLS